MSPDGPGRLVGPFLTRGLRRHGNLDERAWIVALDKGKRRVYWAKQLRAEP